MNKEESLREQIAQLQQKLDTIEQHTKPKPPRDYFALKLVGGFLGFIAILILLWFLWACYCPLDNDKEIIKASQDSHEALHKLHLFTGSEVDCGNTCVVCHPNTWRYHVRKLRGQLSPFI